MRPPNPEMLLLAREARGLTQGELATELGVSQGRISKMEDGLLAISDSDVQEFARVLRYRPSFFYRHDVRTEAFNGLYRKRKCLSVKFLTKFQANITVRLAQIDRLAKKVNVVKGELPLCDPDEFPGGHLEVARHLRQFFRIPAGPIRNIIEILEDHGIYVIRFDFDTVKLDGVSTYTLEGRPVIFLNSALPPSRQVFTIVHELAHAVMHRLPRPEAEMEQQSDECTAEFLVPEADVRSDFRSCGSITLEALQKLKLRWNVSMGMLLRRTRDLGFADQRRYTTLQVMMSQRGYRKNEPHENLIKLGSPSLESELIDYHLKDLHYTEEQISELLDIPVDEFRTIHRPNLSPFQVVK